MMLLPGPIAWIIYDSWFGGVLALSESRKAIASVVAGFSFTTLGFLAAVITVLFVFSHSETFRRYRNRGYLGLFFYCYFLTIVFLVITSFLALANFSNELHLWLFRAQLISFSNNIGQVGLLTLIICRLAYKASHETAA